MSVYLPIISSFSDKGIKQAKREFASLETRSQKAGFIMKKAFLPATAALAGMAGFLGNAARGAERARIASAGLQSVLKTMGYADATKRVEEYAEALELSLGVDADVIKRTQTKLATFKGLAKTVNTAEGAFDRATKAALDLAAAGFGEAEGNAVQLGKALEDPIKGISALSRAGVTFTAQEKDKIKQLVKSNKLLEAQDIVLSAIEGQVGGTSAATASGMDKMKLALDRVSDVFGEALLPAIEKVVPYFERFATWASNNKTVVMAIAGAFAILATAIVAVNVAMMLNPAVLIVAGLVAIGAALVTAYKRFEGFRNVVDSVAKFLGKAFGGMVKIITGAINQVLKAYNYVNDIWGGQDVGLIGQANPAEASAAKFRAAEQARRGGTVMGPFVPGTREAIIMEQRADRRRLGMPQTGNIIVNNYSADPQAVVRALQNETRRTGSIGGVRVR